MVLSVTLWVLFSRSLGVQGGGEQLRSLNGLELEKGKKKEGNEQMHVSSGMKLGRNWKKPGMALLRYAARVCCAV